MNPPPPGHGLGIYDYFDYTNIWNDTNMFLILSIVEHIDYFYKFCQRHPEMCAIYYCESCSLSVCANCLAPGEDSCEDHVVVSKATVCYRYFVLC